MVNGLPSIMLDRNDSVFYMKSLDGSFKKYRFQEETEPSLQSPMDGAAPTRTTRNAPGAWSRKSMT